MLSAAAGLDAGGVAVLNSALPSLGAEFGASARDLSWAVGGYALAFAGLLLCGGAMADRLRRRRVLVAGLLAVAAGSVLAGLAPAFGAVVAGRVLQGAGAAVTMPAATALLTSVYPEGRGRARALGVFASAQAGCYGAGLVLGGAVTGALGWRWVFAVLALAAVGTAAAAVRSLPVGDTAGSGRGPEPVGAVALVGALVLAVLAADLATRPGGLPTALAVMAAAAACGRLWWLRGRSPATADAAPESTAPAPTASPVRGGGHRAPLLDPGLLRLPGVRIAAVVAVAFYFCVTGTLFLLPLRLQEVRGLSAGASGWAVLPVSLAVSAAALVSGRLLRRYGARILLSVGLLLTAGGVLVWCLPGDRGVSWPAVLTGLVVSGCGQGVAFPALVATGLDGVAPGDHGTASAVTVTALQLGSATGPAVLAAIGQAVSGPGPGAALGAGSGPGSAAALSVEGYRLAYAAAAGVLLVVGLPAVARLGRHPGARGTRGKERGAGTGAAAGTGASPA
ncbi:MFS transporter [Streptomyces sp. NPDC097619]|uniref:MFS transporter n=1 Tax=Streptomyces sp. NPDC097619 TaxID=3157228 RepID=UPI003329AE80